MVKWKRFFASGMNQSSKAIFRGFALMVFIVLLVQSPAAVARNGPTAWLQEKDLINVEDGKFSCPETLPTLDARKDEARFFLMWTKKQHPRWTLEQILKFRITVLSKYECNKTLTNILTQPALPVP